MTTLGNIFLALSTLIYLVMLSSIYGAKPPQSGDAAMGYPIGVILLNLAFLAFMALTTGIIAWKGDLEWVAADKASRYALVIFGLLGIVIVNALSGLFKYENLRRKTTAERRRCHGYPIGVILLNLAFLAFMA
jgi:hypothetical protein